MRHFWYRLFGYKKARSFVESYLFIREKFEKKRVGCLRISRSVIIHAETYEVVLLLDADVQFHKNFDELFDTLETTLGWTHGAGAAINQEVMTLFLVFLT